MSDKDNGWKRYYESWRPIGAPNDIVDTTVIESGHIWWLRILDVQMKLAANNN